MLSKRLTVPSLMLSNFVNFIPQLITSLLLIEIAVSFDIEVGIAGQLGTTQSIVSAVMALLMGALSVRYHHKSLLLAGIVVLSIAALGCSIASTFGLLLVVFAFTGISLVMVMPMSQSLIGSLFSVQARPRLLGYLMAGYALAYVIGPHIITFLGDWRLAFLLLTFPLTLISLVLAFMSIPSTAQDTPTCHRYWQGFRAVVQNKSATACIVANVLFNLAIRVLHYYSLPFYRQQFLLDPVSMSLLVTGSSSIFVIGSVIGGRLVTRFGRKPLTMFGAFFTGVMTVAFINVPNFWLSLGLMYTGTFMVVMRNVAYNSLVLEQEPAYRGTMMSLSQFSQNVAGALSASVGGLILITFDYGSMGLLGTAAIIAAVLFHFFTIDPTTQGKQQETTNA